MKRPNSTGNLYRRYKNMAALVKSGFAFFAVLNEHETLMENKFTGLRIIYDDRTGNHRVVEE